MKPTLEEVKEYFKDAETIESLYGKKFENKYEFNYSNENDGIYVNNGGFQVWNPERGYAKILTYKDQKFEITKERILELAKKCSSHEYAMKEAFPEAFKKELEEGKWYKDVRIDSKALFYLEEIIPHKTNGMKSYGFSMTGEWTGSCNRSNDVFEKFTEESTPQEVETALFAEAKKRGYKEGVCCNNSNVHNSKYDNHILLSSLFTLEDGCLFVKEGKWERYRIFNNGKWATIIETITIQEAEKLLNRKIV